MTKTRLIRNSAECAKCGDVLVSRHRHDWVMCRCGAIYIDGGLDYIRTGGSPENFIDRCQWEEYEDGKSAQQV